MACRSDIQAPKHKFGTFRKNIGFLGESPNKHRKVSSLSQTKKREIGVDGARTWENPERLKHHKTDNENIRHNAPQQCASNAFFSSAPNIETSPVSPQEHSFKRKLCPASAAQDSISTSLRLKLYFSEEQISTYQRKRQLSVGADHTLRRSHSSLSTERIDKRKANAAPIDDNLHVKRSCPNYRSRGELEMPITWLKPPGWP